MIEVGATLWIVATLCLTLFGFVVDARFPKTPEEVAEVAGFSVLLFLCQGFLGVLLVVIGMIREIL